MKVILQLIRPGNWIKNVFVFAPAFFSGELFNVSVILNVCWAAVAFCLCSSAVYCMNDVADAANDALNPAKALRPVAAGKIGKTAALSIGLFLAVASLVLSFFTVGEVLVMVILSYLILNVLYTFWLKRVTIIDITVIALGFILRLCAGSVAAGCMLSHWIVLLTFLLSLFLALGKRREDFQAISNMQSANAGHLPTRYSLHFIDSAMSLVGAAAITSYFLYTVSPNPGRIVSSSYLYVTGFPVVVGILRYLQICIDNNRGARHHRVIFTDPLIVLCIATYLVIFIALWIYDTGAGTL